MKMTKRPYSLMLAASFVLVGCASGGDYSDLDEFVQNSGKGLRGQVDPIPEVKPYTHFTYDAFDLLNPFLPRKNENPQTVSSKLQPDLARRKEVLEHFPLENLEMVGSLMQHQQIFALIRSPDGALHRVKAGNHLGQDFGRINQISESEVTISEIVRDGVSEWTPRVSTLMLKD